MRSDFSTRTCWGIEIIPDFSGLATYLQAKWFRDDFLSLIVSLKFCFHISFDDLKYLVLKSVFVGFYESFQNYCIDSSFSNILRINYFIATSELSREIRILIVYGCGSVVI